MRRSSAGFTLVEILIATTIIGFVVAGTVILLRQALYTNAYDASRVKVVNDMMQLEQNMAADAIYANNFYLYANFTSRTTTVGTVTGDANLGSGSSGDMVVFIGTTTTGTTSVGTLLNTWIAGYFLDATSTTAGPVRRFYASIPSTSADATATPGSILNDLFPASTATSTYPEVIPLAYGESLGLLFYNYNNHSIMVNSQIKEQIGGGSATTGTGGPVFGQFGNYAQSTYNFTITPRG